MTMPAPTAEQQVFIDHVGGAFVEACPGAGKTRAIVSRVQQISQGLPTRKGVAVLSFTNTAVDEFKQRCFALDIDSALKHPGYIGTFDSFLRHFFVLPGGIPGTYARPHVVDSWDTLGIDEVRLSGTNAFAGPGVSLDRFNPFDNTINPDTINHAGLKAHVQANKIAYERIAGSYRNALRNNGNLSAADARIVALENLGQAGWSEALGQALSARFSEIIVDEAQDCNHIDLGLLEWLKECGIAVTVVCDPDQAIYGFRQGNPAELLDFRSKYNNSDRLQITGNFRSSSPICSIAATLRDRADPDTPLGEHGEIDTPIQLLEYRGASAAPTVGEKFIDLTSALGICNDQSYILSHSRKAALQASGHSNLASAGGTSSTAKMARAVSSFWSSSGSGKNREFALRHVEKLLLQIMDKIEDNEPVQKAIERNELNVRWLRRIALELLTALPKTCEHSDAGRDIWVTALQTSVRELGVEYGNGKTETNFFTRRGSNDWSKALQENLAPTISCATVHEAKGREYDAVCLVVSPNRAPQSYTEQLFDAWENRTNDEAKRVAYVAITRAKKFAAIAVPTAYCGRLKEILDGAGVPWELHDLTGQ